MLSATLVSRPVPVAALMILAIAAPAVSAALVIPEEPDVPPLALTRHRVNVDITGQGATTTVEQVFKNNTQRRLEAQYVFPIPKGAALSRFTIELNGRPVRGEMVRNEKARRVYESAVRRSGDAGLLEYLGNDVLRAKLFPVEPESPLKIAVRFHQALAAENGLAHYVYPLRNGSRRGPTVHGEFSIDATIKSAVPIRSVYSPSHTVAVDRSRRDEVRVTYSEKDTTLVKDFHLYYSASDQGVGLNVVTYQPRRSGPGYFLMLVSPRSRLQAERVIERDLVFVVDTSGSMEGEKMKQAKNALKHCVTSLNKGDRFGLVRFSTDVYPWHRRLLNATGDHRQSALRWIDDLTAQGGTDMTGALDAALSFPMNPARPVFVVFLTDGRPTLGRTVDPNEILAGVKQSISAAGGTTVRVFTWGVGYDVDTQLLDGIASTAGGVSEYVRPEEDIAVKVTSFYNKTSYPLLTDVKLEVKSDRIELLDMHPKAIPDLYAGSQLVILGRFKDAGRRDGGDGGDGGDREDRGGDGNRGDLGASTAGGDVALRLTGRVNESTETFDYKVSFPSGAADAGREFVELLWARRRIGHLLDSIRLRGEEAELVAEVKRLAMKYGIQTPYTSFVILQDGQIASASGKGGAFAGRHAYTDLKDRRARLAIHERLDELAVGERDVERRDLERQRNTARAAAEAESPAARASSRIRERSEAALTLRRAHNRVARSLEEGFRKRGGQAAVETASYLRRLKQATRADRKDSTVVPFRAAAGTRFFAYRGLWVDERFEGDEAVTVVKFGSAAYFRLLAKRPRLTGALKLSRALVYVTARGKALVIATRTGAETLANEEVERLFAPAQGNKR